MLIVAKQDNADDPFAIWNTVTDRFLGANLSYDDCIKTIMDYKGCSYENAKDMADYPQPFDYLVKQVFRGLEPNYAEEKPDDIKNAVRLIVNRYKRDDDFRNAFVASIASALKEIPTGTGLYDASKIIADRIMGNE